jgi:hypothetical protein
LLGGNLTSADEEDLEAELDQLAQDADAKIIQRLPHVPTHRQGKTQCSSFVILVDKLNQY